MAHVNRRIGKSSETAMDTADGTGGGVLDAFIHDYFNRSGNVYNFPGFFTGMTATGGVISDYTSGSDVYRAHVFTSSGTFDVSAIGSFGADVEYLVVGGGGGGGGSRGGGGGAGGYRTGTGLPISASPGSYTVTVGSGGVLGQTPGTAGGSGNNSVFSTITSAGGGGGGGAASVNGGNGGSGGGGAGPNGSGGTGNTPPSSPSQGNSGGSGSTPPAFGAGGGGGSGGAGGNGSSSAAGTAGPGTSSSITGTSVTYAAGGAGGDNTSDANGTPGTHSTGNGGGGAKNGPAARFGGSGGSGVVVVRYQIGTVETGTAKATGGAISFYSDKTIHTFVNSGTFTAPGSFNETLEYVIIGGGGSGVRNISGGGGAGAYRTGTTPIDNTGPGNPSTVTVQVGGGGVENAVGPVQGGDGTPSYFGTPLTSAGGGGGGYYGKAGNNSPGGSGGGGGTHVSGYPGPGSQAYSGGTSGSYGNDGGAGWYGNGRGGGGGGAGGAGEPGQNTGKGGDGVRIPTTFHNPKSAPTPATPAPTAGGGIGVPGPAGGFYVAGGGGGGTLKGSATGSLAGGAGGYGGGGSAADPFNPLAYGQNGVENTGSGGSATNVGPPSSATSHLGGNGGSGIVLIAYPT